MRPWRNGPSRQDCPSWTAAASTSYLRVDALFGAGSANAGTVRLAWSVIVSEMRVRSWSVLLLALICVGACAANSSVPAQTTETVSLSTFASTASAQTSTTTELAPPEGADVLVVTSATGFGEVEEALAAAVDRWETAGPDTYGYRVSLDGDSVERRVTWVRMFDWGEPETVAWNVEELFGWAAAAMEGSPDRVEVAFDSEMGVPVWLSVEGERSESILVEEFHEITSAATPYDGSWRFIEGEIEGHRFANPTTGLIVATFRHGYVSYPIDCNQADGQVDIHGTVFGVGLIASTAAGCPEYSDEAELFTEALETASTIDKEGSELVLAGEGSVLRFVPLEDPQRRDELPLTAAGETLVIGADSGDLTSVFTISTGDGSQHPGRSMLYTLTAVEAGSGEDPTWRGWDGEFEVPAQRPGPVEVVIPENIGVGDYQLCSPYWAEDFYCYDLLVRPPSAPWYVTAGSEGVILHDADGTSRTVWEEPTRTAFWFDDLMLIETDNGQVLAVSGSDDPSEVSSARSRLLDAATVGDFPRALIIRDGQTVLVEVGSADDTTLGAGVIEGRIAADVVILRTAPTRIEARSPDGSTLWQLAVDADQMISLVTPTEMRLDRGRLSTEGAPFFQYLDTTIVDIATGEVIDQFTTELAIPLHGDEVTEPCLRAELRDGLMLCPQADGRFTTIGVEGGDQLTILGLTNVTATYVRSRP